jgi:c-di-AMP phosphodiesterase-like protein
MPELADRTEKLAVIDHHRKTSEFEREPDVEYIEPSASAACELVAEMLEQVLPNDDLSAAEATLMLAGITLDTNHFAKDTGTRTFSAAMYLRDRGADPGAVQQLFRENYSDYIREVRFRSNVEIYRGVTAITIVEDAETDASDRIIAAKAADNLLKVTASKLPLLPYVSAMPCTFPPVPPERSMSSSSWKNWAAAVTLKARAHR